MVIMPSRRAAAPRLRRRTEAGTGVLDPRGSGRGFTLLELIIVMVVIGLLVAIAVPSYRDATDRAKEAVLAENLYRMREAIDEYYTDKGHYPLSLQDLVRDGYLREIPQDPITESADTWQVEYAPWEMTDQGQPAGIWDLHSGATGTSLEGEPYSEF